MTPYVKDSTWGAYRVIALIGIMDDGSGRYRVRAQCTKCGEIHEVSSNTLRQSKNNRAKSCSACMWQRPQHEPKAQKRCKKCEGMPWRRPVDRACKCGERFEPEMIPRPEILHSNASIASDNCVISYRRATH